MNNDDRDITMDGDYKMINGYYVEDDRYDESDLQQPDEWLNLGDANPDRHGGNFIRWKGGMWHVVVTIHAEDLPEDMMDGKSHMIESYWFEPEDVWLNGNPAEGFTHAAQWGADALGKYGPETTWDMDSVLGIIAADLPAYANWDSDTFYLDENADYWSELEAMFGITQN